MPPHFPFAVKAATRHPGVGTLIDWTTVLNGAANNAGCPAAQLLGRQGRSFVGTPAQDHTYLSAPGATPMTYGDCVTIRIRPATMASRHSGRLHGHA